MDYNFVILVVAVIAAIFAVVSVVLLLTVNKQLKVVKTDELLSYLNRVEQQIAAVEEKLRLNQAVNEEKIAALENSLTTSTQRLETKIDDVRRENAQTAQKNTATVDEKLEKMREIVDEKLTVRLNTQSSELRDHLAKFDTRFAEFSKQIQGFQEQINNNLAEVRKTVEEQLKNIREDNGRQLDKVRETVDEKLSKTLNENLSRSFNQVRQQLEAVYKGLGEMQNVAKDVGGLKRVLSNVKTRGVLGEVQLGAILSDILTRDKYEENVATKPGSLDRVEFAVKIPVEDGDYIYLPIDAKFPGDTYDQLRVATESGDKAAIDAARKALEVRIKSEAKDICEKYISVPHTTNFAIMFLPFEGLYAEVVDRPGLLECLQRDYRVNVAGPSTMAALLNSLQMSYQTLALQKRADEIAQILSAVKAEFPKYQKELDKALKQIQRAGNTVEGIINTRTKVIDRKLRGVANIDYSQAERVLGFSDTNDEFASLEEAEINDDGAEI